MNRDHERVERLTRELTERGWDALVVTQPANVLLVSGYWPVLGHSLGLIDQSGQVVVLAPEDEQELAAQGWADTVRRFQPSSLEHLTHGDAAVRGPLGKLAAALGLRRGATIGYEDQADIEPCTYVGMYRYGATLPALLGEAMPGVELAPASASLGRLRAVLTPRELECVRAACKDAERAYMAGARDLRTGLREYAAAELFHSALLASPAPTEESARVGGSLFCMSGPRAARSAAAYQRTGWRQLGRGDLALIHCNSYRDGFFTDISRTFCLGEPDAQQRRMYAAVLEAREAALAAIRPGARAADVDRAARSVLAGHGFGEAFKHPTGHGVGFSAINHDAPPRIHPASDEVLATGMTFNVEPGVYLDGQTGLRHCDMVAVTERGAAVLTPFLARLDDLVR
jgi:Xaa-Pro aminopeptidase/Xaa-Pro dipeptidase